jgi:PleD family two-component response regulator
MAWQIAEELRIGIEALGIAHSYPDAESVVTMSVGVTTQRIVSKSIFPNILCDAAIDALYLAKKNGRNQVCRGYIRG